MFTTFVENEKEQLKDGKFSREQLINGNRYWKFNIIPNPNPVFLNPFSPTHVNSVVGSTTLLTLTGLVK